MASHIKAILVESRSGMSVTVDGGREDETMPTVAAFVFRRGVQESLALAVTISAEEVREKASTGTL